MKRWGHTAGMAVLASVLVVLLTACGGGGGSSDSGTAKVRMLNASTGYSSLDFYVDDSKKNSAIAYGAVGEYASIGTSSVSTVVTASGNTSALASASRSFTKDIAYTLVAYGWQGGMKTALLQEDITAADSGKAKLQVFNSAIDAGGVDVYLTGTDDALDNASAVASAVAGASLSGYSSITSGTYRLRVTGAGDKTDLRLDLPSVTLPSTGVATLIVTPGVGGVLTHAVLVAQQGTTTVLNNPLARARVLAALTSNGRVSATLAGTALVSGAVSPTIGSYVPVAAGNDALTLSVNGTPLSMPTQAIAAGGDYTLLVWGDVSTPKLTLVNDDNRLPTNTANAKLRLVHAVAGLDSGLTMTADFSAVANNVDPGTASAYGNVTASSAVRLDVNSPLSINPLYTLSSAALTARGVYTMYMLGTAATPIAAFRRER